jgi:hypothetical protein
LRQVLQVEADAGAGFGVNTQVKSIRVITGMKRSTRELPALGFCVAAMQEISARRRQDVKSVCKSD